VFVVFSCILLLQGFAAHGAERPGPSRKEVAEQIMRATVSRDAATVIQWLRPEEIRLCELDRGKLQRFFDEVLAKQLEGFTLDGPMQFEDSPQQSLSECTQKYRAPGKQEAALSKAVMDTSSQPAAVS
jgi:hypothetical protein